MNKVIEVKNLSKNFKVRTNRNLFTGIFNPRYELVKAVQNISFDVVEGESLAFLGPNGAGKTTTTKMLTGLMYPSGGQIQVLGFTPQERKKQFLMQIGLVMGNKSGLSWDLTGEQSFRFIQKIYNIDEKAYVGRVTELCELLDVAQHLKKQIRRLSLGERMKLELIGAILHRPKVLFLDEPTIGLDITSKKNVRNFLRAIQKNSNITLLLTSHDMDDVERVCDRVVVVNKGTKVFDDTLTKLTSGYNEEKHLKVYFEEKPEDLSSFNCTHVEKIDKDAVTFAVEKSALPKLIADIIAKYKVLDIDIISTPLEEMIEDIYKKSTSVASIAPNV